MIQNAVLQWLPVAGTSSLGSVSGGAGPSAACEVLDSTSLGTWSPSIAMINQSPPDVCCQHCQENSECGSWTVVDFSNGANPICHLKAANKAQQLQHKHDGDSGWACTTGCDRPADARFTSGFLTSKDDGGGSGGKAADAIENLGRSLGGWYLVLGVLAVIVVYLGVGGILWRRRVAGRSGLLPHPEFWGNAWGLVVDGLRFTNSKIGRSADVQSPVPVVSLPAVGAVTVTHATRGERSPIWAPHCHHSASPHPPLLSCFLKEP